MKKPECTTGYNLSRTSPGDKNLRMVCLYAKHRELLKQILENIGGYESSGICENHYDYAIYDSNRELNEEEIQEKMEFEKKIEEARKKSVPREETEGKSE